MHGRPRISALVQAIVAVNLSPVRALEPAQVVEANRGNSTERGYGYRWQQARAGYLRHHPLCVRCEAKGIVTAAAEVDHIVPHRGDMVLFWDRDNWQGLCKPCHSEKTARENGGFGNQAAR